MVSDVMSDAVHDATHYLQWPFNYDETLVSSVLTIMDWLRCVYDSPDGLPGPAFDADRLAVIALAERLGRVEGVRTEFKADEMEARS